MSKQRYIDESDEFFIEEERVPKVSSLRQDTELFDDASYVPQELISVRRIALPQSGEDWEVIRDKKTVLTLKGIRFTKKEKDFLRKPEGLQFIMKGYKQGWVSISEYKRQVKKCLK